MQRFAQVCQRQLNYLCYVLKAKSWYRYYPNETKIVEAFLLILSINIIHLLAI